MAIPDPDEIWPKLDELGADEVRKRLAMGVYGEHKIPVIEEWLRRQDRQGNMKDQEPSVESPVPVSTSTEEDWPAKVTLGWLIAHMPISAWAWLCTIIAAAFLFGAKFGQTQFGNEILGSNNQVRVEEPGSSSSPSESSAELAQISEPASSASYVGADSEFFVAGNPFPKPFQNYKFGTKMSTLMEAFPDFERSSGGGHINYPDDHPLWFISYDFDYDRVDPSFSSVAVYARNDEESTAILRREVLSAFHTFPNVESRVDDTIYWDDMNGYALSLQGGAFSIRDVE